MYVVVNKTNLMADGKIDGNALGCDDSIEHQTDMAVRQALDRRNLVNDNRRHLDAPFRPDALDFVYEKKCILNILTNSSIHKTVRLIYL